MVVVDTYPERYADSLGFAREVNLPLLGTARAVPLPAGAGLAQLLESSAASGALGPIVDGLSETRRSLTLRSLLLAGFPHDPECFAVGLALGREWSRRGLKVAVVDLDFWNPTIVRPPSHPNEGLVDVLEYGCSFGRVAWEVVADHLWVIGPGSHPPDEAKVAEHPDWARAARVFASYVDVALYVAPLLDRRSFTGKLSKRMDAAILAASVGRIDRSDLRDAFLELWGSDAPMIGIVGLEPAPARVGASAAAAPAVETPPAAKAVAAVPARTGSAAPHPAAPSPERERAEVESVKAERAKAERVKAARPEAPRVERDLEAALDRDVRRGIVERPASRRRAGRGLAIGAVAAVVLAAGAFALFRSAQLGTPRGAIEAQQPAGEEPVAPAPQAPLRSGLGAAGGAGLPDQGAAVPGPSGSEGSAPAPPPAAGTAPGAATPAAGTPPSAGSPAPGAGATAPPAANAPAKPFYVHVASFRSQAKVEEIVRGLEAKGLDAWWVPPPKNGAWYRVFVGRFATEAEAAAYAKRLLESGAVDRAQSYPQTKR